MVDTTKNTMIYTTWGTRNAKPVQPLVAAKLISKAKRPLLVVGADVLESDVLSKAIELGKKGMQIAATGHSMQGFKDQDVNAKYINIHFLATYLGDKTWKGLDGLGPYDLLIFLAHKKYYLNQVLSGLKNFTDIKTLAIDRHYFQNADMSFGNLKPDDHLAALDELISNL
ncbi:CO dehydrogenase/acetyl-CoA synthase complex, epsilon subunit [Methanomethylovorans hollandica DSM 15978]|uniref:Acetyl-CoA decarbonylase/synthase complex subunit epsilon n=1 Tax=Methanomethylovorans hollandica (strain DSM 15978 / NBRC 107637 / DMS1) TaxID=867904 RepID=L0KWZ4_METHD|nr:CO dehydrogenase/acetyl-CoA synthase complex subunit epsilon [Methanomethylovorans hollandica]AGB49215.1 CO dehydrogenase/acetyl-CoA synthase complex, epsilon subunit [Methanomethylovorans hollandica DSM 15978]